MKFAKTAIAAAGLVFSAAVACLPLQAAMADTTPKTAAKVENFTLTDQAGAKHELYGLSEAPAIVIVTHANGDPLSREAITAMEGFKAIFSKAEYFVLNSTPGATPASLAAEAKSLGTTIPILHDGQQTVARNLGVTQTAEAYIINPIGWKVVYHGPVTASAAEDPSASYLLFNALVHVMGHRVVEETDVAVKGAPIRIAAGG